MAIRYECNRCGVTDDIHCRSVEMEYIGPSLRAFGDADESWYLCGYCASLVRKLIASRKSRVEVDA